MRNFIIAFLVCVACPAWAEIKVVDGDSLEINGRRSRMEGIDAPEYQQICYDKAGAGYDCGERAKLELKRRIARGNVRCNKFGKDKYKRDLVICYAGEENINASMAGAFYASGAVPQATPA